MAESGDDDTPPEASQGDADDRSLRSLPGFDAALHGMTRRVTPQRRHLYAILEAAPGHPTADELYGLALPDMPMLSRRTVYDALNLFVELGLVHRIDTGTGAVHYDTNITMHAHIVCPVCHALREADVDVDGLRRALGDDELDWVDVVIHRRCDACAAAATSIER